MDVIGNDGTHFCFNRETRNPMAEMCLTVIARCTYVASGTFLLKQRLAKSGIASPLGGEDRKFKSCSADNSVLVSMVAYLKILTLC